jgi:hypothetical protein
MNSKLIQSLRMLAAVACLLQTGSLTRGEVLLDENWADGSRAESEPPKEAAVWAGREADVRVQPGSLTTRMTPSSQKIWTYFTAKEPVKLEVGRKLVASLSFVPRGKIGETTSRSLRIGLFHDPTDARVESDVNSDAGGDDAPWRDAKGYAVQVLVTGDEYSSTKPFDLGKRINFESESLLGTSGDYVKVSGGSPVALEVDKEYTVSLTLERSSKSEVEITAAYRQGDKELASWTVFDDGSYLGTEPIYDTFDLLFIRLSDAATTAEQMEFTQFKVELSAAAEIR